MKSAVAVEHEAAVAVCLTRGIGNVALSASLHLRLDSLRSGNVALFVSRARAKMY